MKPLLSVVICTRNRASALCRALGSLAVCAVPAQLSWQVLVVDNGSSDNTAAVADGFRDRLPMRLVHEPVAGLSQARNRGQSGSPSDRR